MSGPLRIAVTGGSGRIGQRLVTLLVAHGHQVVSLDQRPLPTCPARFFFGDLRDRSLLHRSFADVDAVAHLGEIPNVEAPVSADSVYHHNTAVGSAVMQTAADLGVKRLVYASSCQAYGLWGQQRVAPVQWPMDETHPLLPQNAYGLAKAMNEGYAQLIARLHGVSVAIFRFPWVLDKNPDFTVAEDRAWLEGHTGPCETAGIHVHLDDLAEGFRLALEQPRLGCEAYHFSADDVLTGRPIRERLRDHEPTYPPLPDDWPFAKSPLITAKARDHFGWRPQWNLAARYRDVVGHDPVPTPIR